MANRISIRASTYRGVAGWSVNAGQGRDIFCTTREQAEKVKALLRAELPPAEHSQRMYALLCGSADGP